MSARDGIGDNGDRKGRAMGRAEPVLWPALMRKAQDGDGQAYRLLLGSMMPAIQSLVRRRVFDEALAEDVVQDTMMTLHRVRHTYDPARPMMPWIAAIAATRAVDALRRQGRVQRREIWDETVLAMELDPDASARMEDFAVQGEVSHLLSSLPARQRQAVEMVKLQEMSLDHVAQATSQSVPALKALLHRAFAKLRQNGVGDNG
ncbi:RNA polymerase sigma factor [Novosphingobium terrae]|uniref:RNA polymerase sigma factor n=1 Tax=Novosphingobium terrae TaxID=2726189 RepID=UPI00197D104D|nr:sigma-70 family RNA polymerase sigma factor [Novosphingobium terrae]